VLRDQEVTLWDAAQGDGEVSHETIPGGPTALSRAPLIAAILGYREITLFGADSSGEGRLLVRCDGEFRTSPQLLGQAVYMAEMIPRMSSLNIAIEGEHLLAAMLRTNGRWSVEMKTGNAA
jgi:hypothetical protein